jgi:DNA-binding response OmpR family regulator
MPALLVDGDENFRRALAVALRLEGLSVLEAASVEEAGAALAVPGAIEAAVVDLLLPGARPLLGRLPAGLRLVACSPHRESFAGLPAAVETLQKPFGPATLIALLAPRSNGSASRK